MAQAQQPSLFPSTSVPHPQPLDPNDPQTSDTLDGRDRSHTFPTISIQSDGHKKMRMSLSKEKMSLKVLLLGNQQAGKTALITKFIQDEFVPIYRRTVGTHAQARNCDVPIEIVEEVDEDDGWVPSMPSFDELSRAHIVSPPTSLSINGLGSQRSDSNGAPFGLNVKTTTAVVNVRLKIVDAGVYAVGQNSDKDLSGVHGVIIVVDLSNRETMEALPHWVRFIQENVVDRRRSVKLGDGNGHTTFKDELAITVVANKYDITEDRAFSMSELETYCNETIFPSLREMNASSLDIPRTIRVGGGGNASKRRKGNDKNKINPDFQIIPTSAKTGYNVEHIFESILQRILPPRLIATSHTRTRTTAQIRAPIWLRQLALGMGDDDEDGDRDYGTSEDEVEYSQNDDELDDDGMMLGAGNS